MRGKGRATDTARRGTASSEGTKVLSHAGKTIASAAVLTSAVPVAAIATAAIVITVEESKGRGIKHKP